MVLADSVEEKRSAKEMIVLYLAILILPLPVKLFWDWTAWKKNKRIDHPLRWFAIGSLIVALSLLVWMISPARYWIQPFVLSWAIFWMLFDYLINIVENRSWFYIPEPDDDYQSMADKIYFKIGVWKLLLAKVAFLAGGLALNNWLFE